jgi:DNA invertase Pin-like site-specific DNA recombinase
MEKIDRYSRDVVEGINHMKYLEEEGIIVIFVYESIDTATAMGRFNFGLKLLMAQLEREQTAERTTTTLRLKRMRGEKDTYKRYGWDEQGQPIKSEQKVLQHIRHSLHNNWGLTTIAEGLNTRNWHKRNNKEWTASDIYKIKNGRHFEMMDYDNN